MNILSITKEYLAPLRSMRDIEKESRISNAKKKNRVKNTKILVIY